MEATGPDPQRNEDEPRLFCLFLCADGRQGVLKPIIAPLSVSEHCSRRNCEVSAGPLLFLSLPPKLQCRSPLAREVPFFFPCSPRSCVARYDPTTSQLAAPRAAQQFGRHTCRLIRLSLVLLSACSARPCILIFPNPLACCCLVCPSCGPHPPQAANFLPWGLLCPFVLFASLPDRPDNPGRTEQSKAKCSEAPLRACHSAPDPAWVCCASGPKRLPGVGFSCLGPGEHGHEPSPPCCLSSGATCNQRQLG